LEKTIKKIEQFGEAVDSEFEKKMEKTSKVLFFQIDEPEEEEKK